MKIDNLSSPSFNIGADISIDLKDGETYAAIVKERLQNNEATLQIRGKDVQVKFEGEIPMDERITVQITGIDGRIPVVKGIIPISVNQGIPYHQVEQDIAKLLNLNGNISAALLKQTIQLLSDNGVSINNRLIDTLKSFLATSKGNDVQKMEVIRLLLNKNLDITTANLVAVDEALHGTSITELLQKLSDSSNEHDGRKTETNLHIKLKPRLSVVQSPVEISSLIGELNKKLDLADNHSDQQSDLHPTIVIKLHADGSALGNEGTAKDILIEKSEDNDIDHPNRGSINSIKAAVNQNLETILNVIQNMQEYEQNDYLQNIIRIDSKEFIVSEVTEKLANVTQQFRQLQREISRNLDHLVTMTQPVKTNVLPQIKPLLESTIDIIDKTILKSDIMLFTDMKTEKELLHSSSQLAEARRLLTKGDISAARDLLNQVKAAINNLLFKPTDTKIRHYISDQYLTLDQKFTSIRYIPNIHHFEPSARNMFEIFRSMGLNYDSEVAQKLSLNIDQLNHGELQNNLKAALLSALKSEQEQPQPRLYKEMEQVINHITGQQLLSKSDSGSNLQSMFFSIPILLGRNAENLKIFVNSKNDGQKIDWENCSLYFLINTKKLGETGILINATDRNLSITLRNDQPQIKAKFEGLVGKYKEKLQDIGYNIRSIQFTRLTSDLQQEKAVKDNKSVNSPQSYRGSKGFDFKI